MMVRTMITTPHQIVFGVQDMWHPWARTEKCTRFWPDTLKEGYIFDCLGTDRKIILN